MAGLEWYQYALIALVFVWSGFVRSGLGFGGAVLSLPFLLLIHNAPLAYLPLIAVHLLVFSSLAVWQNQKRTQRENQQSGEQHEGTVDWRYLKYSLAVMIVPKLIGVFGLITLPNTIMSAIIFSIVAVWFGLRGFGQCAAGFPQQVGVRLFELPLGICLSCLQSLLRQFQLLLRAVQAVTQYLDVVLGLRYLGCLQSLGGNT